MGWFVTWGGELCNLGFEKLEELWELEFTSDVGATGAGDAVVMRGEVVGEAGGREDTVVDAEGEQAFLGVVFEVGGAGTGGSRAPWGRGEAGRRI